jgi:hypothetical protein
MMRCLALLVALLPLSTSFVNATLELERDLEHRRLKGTRTPAQRIAEGEKALLALRSKITQLYGVSEKVMTQDTKYYSKENDKKVSLTVVQSLLLASHTDDSFLNSLCNSCCERLHSRRNLW